LNSGGQLIKKFYYSWAAYWMLVFLLPVHSIYRAVTQAFLLQLSFVALVSIGYLTITGLRIGASMPPVTRGDIPATRKLIKWSIYMSLIGLTLLLYDKIYIQHIDYSDGIAVAREQWRSIGEDREGKASSIWSAVGYLIGSAYYVTTVLVIAQFQKLTDGERIRLVMFCFVMALANSIITGGRSNLLLLAVVGLSAFSVRSSLGIRRIFQRRRQRQVIAALLICSACYIVYVFLARAEAGGQLVYQYVTSFLPYMGLDFDGWYASGVDRGWIGAPAHLAVLVLGYLSHSFATCAAIIDAPHEDKIIIFGNFASLLYKIGLVSRPDGDWFLAGRFPTVPGAYWHQFGSIGFTVASLATGAASGIAERWAILRPRLVLPLAFYVLSCSTLILSPYAFAPDFLSFPFVVSAFVLLAVISRLRVYKHSWVYITPHTSPRN
jgi:uncharacterized membrane protein